MKRIAATHRGDVAARAAAFNSPQKLRMIPAMDEKPATLKPKRWLAHLPLVILPLLAAAVIEGPHLKRQMEHQLTAALAAAGQGWAKVTITGRDVEIRGEAPNRASPGRRSRLPPPPSGCAAWRRMWAPPRNDAGDMSMDMLADALNFTGTTVLLRFHWFWMLVALALGAWVGWRTAGEVPANGPRADRRRSA